MKPSKNIKRWILEAESLMRAAARKADAAQRRIDFNIGMRNYDYDMREDLHDARRGSENEAMYRTARNLLIRIAAMGAARSTAKVA